MHKYSSEHYSSHNFLYATIIVKHSNQMQQCIATEYNKNTVKIHSWEKGISGDHFRQNSQSY